MDPMKNTNSPDDSQHRLNEAALAVLQAAPGCQMNFVALNKALFYLDLIALQATGQTVTGSAYVALHQGPVVAKYESRLVKPLEDAHVAIQTKVGSAKPIRVMAQVSNFPHLADWQIHLASTLGRVLGDKTSTLMSVISHRNPGWKAAYEAGLSSKKWPMAIDMMLALQQLGEADLWLDEAPASEDLADLEKATIEDGACW
ncbi:MAG: DUF4065 domain-containing protein [Planctomycetes bacterium]|nr:DUF4065 domain-containing protein [Planctomycetota bacterium]